MTYSDPKHPQDLPREVHPLEPTPRPQTVDEPVQPIQSVPVERLRVEPNSAIEPARVADPERALQQEQSWYQRRMLRREYGDSSRNRVVDRTTRTIGYLFGLSYGLLGADFVLKLLGANPENQAVRIIDTLAQPVAQPFESIVPRFQISDNSVFAPSYLVAIALLALLHAAIANALRLLRD